MNKNTITLTDEQLKAFNSGEDVVLKAPQKKPELFKPSDFYYFVNGHGSPIASSVTHAPISEPHSDRVDFFNCFQSRAVAKKAAVRMCRANAVISACLAVDPDFSLEDFPNDHKFWAITYSTLDLKWMVKRYYGSPHCINVVSTVQKAQQAADMLNSLDLPS